MSLWGYRLRSYQPSRRWVCVIVHRYYRIHRVTQSLRRRTHSPYIYDHIYVVQAGVNMTIRRIKEEDTSVITLYSMVRRYTARCTE